MLTLRGQGMPRLRSTGRVEARATCMVHVDVVVADPAGRASRPSCCASSRTLRGEEQPDLAAGGRNGTGLFSRLRDSFGGR